MTPALHTRTIGPDLQLELAAGLAKPNKKSRAAKATQLDVHQEVVLFTRAQAYLELLAERLPPDSLLAHGWSAFLETYGPLIERVAKRSGLPTEDVEDCIQNVWVAVCLTIRDFHHDCQRPRVCGWLRQIVRSKLADIVRQKGRHPAQSFDDLDQVAKELAVEDADPSAEEERQSQCKMVQYVLAELQRQNTEAHEILCMRWFEGRDVKDIAAIKGLSHEVIWQRHHRAQQRFRTLWLQHAGPPFDAGQ